MKIHVKGFAALLVLLGLMAFAFTAGAEGTAEKTPKAGTPYIEWWINNEGGITWEKDGPVSKWLIEKTGVGMYSPLVVWDGGNGYFAKLQTRIATGDLPDIFMPIKGVETSLIKDGLIWNIADYLPKYAPNVWKSIPGKRLECPEGQRPHGKGRYLLHSVRYPV